MSDTISADTSTNGQVLVNSSVTSQIDYRLDKDWFAVSLQGGKTYQIDLEGVSTSAGTLSDPYLFGIYNTNGKLAGVATSNNDGGVGYNSALEWVAPTTATYYISATAIGSATGTYKLTVTGDAYGASTGTAGQVSVGGALGVAGEIEEADDEDWFAVSLQGGQTYQIDLEGSSTSAGTLSDPYLAGIYNTSGKLAGTNTTDDDGGVGNNSALEFYANYTDTYFIAASAVGSGTGTYKLTVTTGAPTATTFSPVDDATEVAIASDITVTFSEAIKVGTGNITLKKSDGTVVAIYDAAASSNLSVSDKTLTINPTDNLDTDTTYELVFDEGAIVDLNDNK